MGSGSSVQCKIRHCTECYGDTEFYCNTCQHDLCLSCKEGHVIDLDTIHHDVVIYREKYDIQKHETCLRHPDRMYTNYCYTCKLPVCAKCKEHEQHKILDIRTAYKTHREQYRDILQKIRDTLQLTQHTLPSLREEIKIEDVIEFLSEVQIIGRRQRQMRDEDLLELMSTPVYRIDRYNSTGQHIHTIRDTKGQKLHSNPTCIVENCNGDVIVSDIDWLGGAVVVTDRVGRHRFSYTGHQSGLRLQPRGICTNALSHILVCDLETVTIQIIDKDVTWIVDMSLGI
ncbi:E3 ubiquitin-protein ligase TRIM56-like [Saccostrea cucullata]|uniref:E3 ubiquitin-protein ligase TRIM56-like n=1 Tax=Saccostrea cuccullata TaxID=36930 RepID=UPI002ED2D0B4